MDDADEPTTDCTSIRWAPSTTMVVSMTHLQVPSAAERFCQGPPSNRTWTVEPAVAMPLTAKTPATRWWSSGDTMATVWMKTFYSVTRSWVDSIVLL